MKRENLTIKKAANLLKVNEMTLRALIKKGQIKPLRRGRFLYLDPKTAFKFALNQRFYTIKEVAQNFKVTHITIRKLIRTKKFNALKLGTIYRIPEKEILRFTGQTRIMSLLAIKDLQKELEKSRLTVSKLIREGKIPSFKIGRLYRVTREALIHYLKEKQEKVYTVNQTANLLKVHPALIRRLIREAKIQATKIDKRYFITERALFVFLKK